MYVPNIKMKHFMETLKRLGLFLLCLLSFVTNIIIIIIILLCKYGKHVYIYFISFNSKFYYLCCQSNYITYHSLMITFYLYVSNVLNAIPVNLIRSPISTIFCCGSSFALLDFVINNFFFKSKFTQGLCIS